MRRLVLASCDTFTTKTNFINAVKAAQKKRRTSDEQYNNKNGPWRQKNTICILNELGKVVNETTVANTSNDLKTFFSKYKGATIAPSVSM